MTNIELITGNSGTTIVEVTTGAGTTQVELVSGVGSTHYAIGDGRRGPAGEQGPVGEAGPNEITIGTETNLTGFIYGNGTNVGGATTGSTSATPNNIAIRNASGNLTANAYVLPDGTNTATIDNATLTASRTYTLPDASGTVTLTTNANGANDHTQIYAKAAVPIAAGQAVYISGASGSNKIITLAQANTDATSSKAIGIAAQSLATNGFGYVVAEGDLRDLSINLGSGHGVNEGDPIWLSPTTAGGLLFGLANKPSAPDHLVFLGIVTRITGNTLRDIFVKVQNGFELEELHNVAISNPTDNQVLIYDGGTGLWKNGFEASAISSPDTGETLVLRDNESRIYAYQIRLTEGNFQYGQINPPAFQPSDSSFSYTLPRASGTIALNTTALMLTGAQTAAGAKTFLGQVELQGQSANGGNSALNVNLGDARYGTLKAISSAPITSTTTNFATIVEITLGVGLYQIDAFLASSHNSAYGCKIRFGTSEDIKTGITDNYGRPSVAAFSWPIIDDTYNNTNPYAVRSDSGAVEYRRTITGIVEILTAGTTLRLDYAQLNASTSFPSTARARAHILARKIN